MLLPGELSDFAGVGFWCRALDAAGISAAENLRLTVENVCLVFRGK